MNKKVILRGASAIMPLCIGDFPFSFIVGALSVSAGMSVWQSTAWSAIVIAGSAQMLALNMLKTGATLGVIIFTTLIINLRHVLYSASISGTVREASFFKNALCPMRSPTRCMPPPLKRWKEIKRKISVLWLGDDHLLGDLGAGRFYLARWSAPRFPDIEKLRSRFRHGRRLYRHRGAAN